MAQQEDKKQATLAVAKRIQTLKWPTCVITYQQLLMATCGGNCGQPLVSGAGPGYSTRRVVYDAETSRWFHIRCYDTCSEDDWAQHTRMFTRDSVWRGRPDGTFQATQCQDALRHWAFLKDLVPEQDLRVRCTPWSVAQPPGHLDRFFLDVGKDYARRSVWPECAMMNRPGGTAYHLDLMFPTTHWTQFSVFWTANVATDSKARAALKAVADEVLQAVCADNKEIYATVDLFEPTQHHNEDANVSVVVLRLQVSAVEHSTLHYDPLHILSMGAMSHQLPDCHKVLSEWRQKITYIATTVLNATSKTKPETSIAKLSQPGTWALHAIQARASVITPADTSTSSIALTVAVGLSTHSENTDYYYTSVGSRGDGLAQMHILRTNAKEPVFVPYLVGSGKGVQPEDIHNATQVTVTPYRVMKI